METKRGIKGETKKNRKMMMEILPDNKWKYYLFATLSIISLSTIGACIYRKNKNKGVVKNDTKN